MKPKLATTIQPHLMLYCMCWQCIPLQNNRFFLMLAFHLHYLMVTQWRDILCCSHTAWIKPSYKLSLLVRMNTGILKILFWVILHLKCELWYIWVFFFCIFFLLFRPYFEMKAKFNQTMEVRNHLYLWLKILNYFLFTN